MVGNHDYFFLKKKARHELLVRFPFLDQQTWYVERWGPLAIVVLDSNCHYEKQAKWLEGQLRELDLDPSVQGIIVSGHHPPFTNSFEVPPHTPSRVHFMPLFVKSRKSLAYISGHCHAYEHFEEQGKTFIVTGGGGGPRQHLREGPISRYKDHWPGGRTRPFHYLWVTLSGRGLVIDVWGIRKRQTELWQMECFELPWKRRLE